MGPVGDYLDKKWCKIVFKHQCSGTLPESNISPFRRQFWVDDFPFPKVGYVSSLEGKGSFRSLDSWLCFCCPWGSLHAGCGLWPLDAITRGTGETPAAAIRHRLHGNGMNLTEKSKKQLYKTMKNPWKIRCPSRFQVLCHIWFLIIYDIYIYDIYIWYIYSIWFYYIHVFFKGVSSLLRFVCGTSVHPKRQSIIPTKNPSTWGSHPRHTWRITSNGEAASWRRCVRRVSMVCDRVDQWSTPQWFFHIKIGDKLINPIVRVYRAPMIRIPMKRWDDHPQYSDFWPWHM